MTSIIQTGPGFFAASTKKKEHVLRIYCARLEAYDLPLASDAMDNIQFEILFAKAEGQPEIATMLLELGRAIEGNKALLEQEASKS